MHNYLSDLSLCVTVYTEERKGGGENDEKVVTEDEIEETRNDMKLSHDTGSSD